jgi:hypothetical protein
MLVSFLIYIRGVVHDEFVPQGQTVNATFYVKVLKHLCGRVRAELWAAKNYILHHDNAPSHSALVVHEFFTKNDMITMDHTSYSLNLAPLNFFLFPKVKTIMRGEHFGDVENIKP